jgi:hypothetical protein
MPLFPSNATQPDIERWRMRGRRAGATQKRSGKLAAEFGAMLQHLNRVPGIKENLGAENRSETFGSIEDGTPLLQPLVFIPVDIVDQRIPLVR